MVTSRGSFESAVEETERQYNLGPAAKKQEDYFAQFKDKPFWIKNQKLHEQEYDKTHGKCCFWHIIGLPEKEGRGPLPMFDYEWDLYRAIEEKKYVWLKKSAGLGISSFMLYYIAYKSITSEIWQGKQVVIITGPNIDIAISLVDRLKRLFPQGVLPLSKETVCNIAGVNIRAFPSWNLDAARGIEKPILIWQDEGDYFPTGQSQEARIISERYIPKSPGLSIVMTSTPNAPEGLFETIEKEPEDICLYHRMVMTYEVGLNKIYLPSEIAKARESVSFPREMEGKYIGQVGNVFSTHSIEIAARNGEALESARKGGIPYDMKKSMGIDPSYSSSAFAIVVTGLNRNGVVEVLYAEEYDKPSFNDMINEIVSVRKNYNVEKLYCDDANPEILRALKEVFGEDQNWHQVMLKHKYGSWKQWMSVIPCSFRASHKDMLAHTKRFLDAESLAVAPRFSKLLISLRTAIASEGSLNKDLTSHDDLLDALRMSLQHFVIQTPEKQKSENMEGEKMIA